MTIGEPGDVVRVPFPFVERERVRYRPALIVAAGLGPDASLLWSIMITASQRERWSGDIDVGPGHATYGLPVPCLLRTEKITTISGAAIVRCEGRVPDALLALVMERIAMRLGITAP